MQALGAMRYPRAVEALTGLFNYFGKGDLAEASLDALARIAHPTSAPLFLSVLAGKNSAMKGIAIEGLARLGDKSRLAEIQTALGGERGGRNEGLTLAGQFATVRLNEAPIDQIAEALNHPGLHDQARQYLIEIAPGRSSAFSRYAQDPDAHMRADVADILGCGGDAAALPIVEPMMNDTDPRVAMAAQRAVGRLRAGRAPSQSS
jgi:HEAT repeat protein